MLNKIRQAFTMSIPARFEPRGEQDPSSKNVKKLRKNLKENITWQEQDRQGLSKVEWHEFNWAECEYSALARPKRIRDWFRLLCRGWRFHTVMSGRLYLHKTGAAIGPVKD